jgi:hypothetical protein
MASRQMDAIAEEGRPLNWPPAADAVAGNRPPLMRWPSADAVVGNGATLNTRCAPPSAVADAGKSRHKANVSPGR